MAGSALGSGISIESMYVRCRYFVDQDAVGLLQLASALEGLDRLLVYGLLLDRGARREDVATDRRAIERIDELFADAEWHPGMTASFSAPPRRPPSARIYRLVSVEMQSPLEVVIGLAPYAGPVFLGGIIALAHKIARFTPKVSADRAEEEARRAVAERNQAIAEMERTVFDQTRLLVEEGKVEAMAAILAAQYPTPDTIDFIGAGEDPMTVDLVALPTPDSAPPAAGP